MKAYISFLLIQFILLTPAVADSLNDDYSSFGYAGSDGYNGSDGYSGQSGDDITVFAKSWQSEEFYLDGSDGLDGRDGDYGDNATRCYHDRPAYNLVGANGGSGGRGGDGGRGGHGGDALIYFDDISSLRNIFISSRPGVGGRGARGYGGGDGCRCEVYSWVKEVSCDSDDDGENDDLCKENFFCRDGKQGEFGRHGVNGGKGVKGSLTLVQSDGPLPEENTSFSYYAYSILNSIQTLSIHQYEEKQGALSLLAPGSIVSDYYSIFSATAKAYYKFAWESSRPINDFKSIVFGGNIYNDGSSNAKLYSYDDVFTFNITNEYNSNLNEYVKVHTIKEAFHISEFKGISFKKIEGYGVDTKVYFKDAYKLLKTGNVSIQLTIKRRFGLGWKKKILSGYISDFEITDNEIMIPVGKLVKKPEKWFKKRKKDRKRKYWFDWNIGRNWEGHFFKNTAIKYVVSH